MKPKEFETPLCTVKVDTYGNIYMVVSSSYPIDLDAVQDLLVTAREYIERENAKTSPPVGGSPEREREAMYARVNEAQSKRMDPDEVKAALGQVNLVIGNHLHREHQAS